MKRWTIVFAVAVVAAAMLLPLSAQAQTVNRVVSQYFRWDQSQSNTPNTAKKVIYSHTFFVPSLSTGAPKYNVAYLSVHLVGDANCSGTNCEVQEGLACTLDGTANVNACPNGSAKTFASGGLPYVIFNTGTFPPILTSNMSYTWCVPIKTAGTHQFRLYLGSFAFGPPNSASLSFVEAGMVNIDLAKLPSTSACTAAPDL